MSGYLNRLVQRTQAIPELQSLQPFVRSTSPIAEQDQRLSVAGFQEAMTLNSMPANENSIGNGGQIDGAGAATMPEITASSQITIQRKMANSSSGSLASISPSRSTASPAAMQGVRHNSFEGADRSSLSEHSGTPTQPIVPSRKFGAGVQNSRLQEPTELFSLPETIDARSQADDQAQVDRFNPDFTSRKIDIGTGVETDIEADTPLPTTIRDASVTVAKRFFSPIHPPVTIRNLERSDTQNSNTQNVEQQSIRLDDTGQLQTIAQQNVPSLEPSIRSLVDRSERLLEFEDAVPSLINQPEIPRVVIGRITVEVVPQNTLETPATARSGPLTAASVSVIGSLSRGVSSSVRLSLRQR